MKLVLILSSLLLSFYFVSSSLAVTLKETTIPNVSWAGELVVDSSNNVWTGIINSTDGGLYIIKFNPSTLQFTIYPTPNFNGRPVGITIDSNGNVWVVDINFGAIVRLNVTSNETVVFPVPCSVPVSLAADNQNTIWVGTRLSRSLCRFNTTSEIWTSYFVNTEINHIRYRNGAIWFTGAIPTGLAQGVIGKFNISTSTVTFFNTSSSTNFLNFDSRDNIWFSENRANLLGVLFTNGTIFEYTLPSAGTGVDSPYGVVIDQDDNVWYTERKEATGTTNAIGVLNNFTKTFTTYSISLFPYDISKDSLGNIWYVGAGSWKLGKLNPVTYVVKDKNDIDVSITSPSQVAKGERFTQIVAIRNLLDQEINNITITLDIPTSMETDLNSTQIIIEKIEPKSSFVFNFKTTAKSLGSRLFKVFANSQGATGKSFWRILTINQ